MDCDSEKRSPSETRRIITHSEFLDILEELKGKIIRHDKYWIRKLKGVIGIPRGGAIPAVYLSHFFDLPLISLSAALDLNYNHPRNAFLYIDDVVDTGTTIEHLESSHWIHPNSIFGALIGKPWSPKKDWVTFAKETTDWIQFEWENVEENHNKDMESNDDD